MVGYVDNASEWIERLPSADSLAIRKHLYDKTVKRPRAAISFEPGVFHTFVKIESRRGTIIGYRIDYSITSMAVIILSGKAIRR